MRSAWVASEVFALDGPQGCVDKLWAPLLGVTEAELKEAFVPVLLQCRAGIVLFNLVPWVVLRIMARDPGP